MLAICLGYQQRIRRNSTFDADSPDSLWTRLMSDFDFSAENPQIRYEVLILKEDALAQGLNPDIWSREKTYTDPITKKETTYREDFKYAVSSAEALDVTPTMARATDAQDVEIPIEVMSYVEVPLNLPIGIFWH